MHSKKKRHRVIIVGAGSAGLAAGSLLIDSGFDVKILEASNKICGRVRKLEGFAEFPIELGGEELHGSNNVYKDCILMAGGYLVPEEAYNMYIEYKGDVIPDHRLSVLAARDYGFFEKLLLDQKKQQINQAASMLDFIKSGNYDTNLMHYFDCLTARECGTCMKTMGAKNFASYVSNYESGVDNYLVGGVSHYDVITQTFQNAVQHVQLNCPVTSIDYSRDNPSKMVVVTDSKNRQYECDTVIVAVPITQLQKEKIRFNPPLGTAKTRAINQIEMGPGGKVSIKFRERFWKDDMCMLAINGVCTQMWNVAAGKKTVNPQHILSGLISGQAYALLKDKSREQILDILIADLERAFKLQGLKSQVTGFVWQNWGAEPFIEGQYTSPSMRTEENSREIAREPIDNTVFFAGEAFHQKHFATIHGAIETGFEVTAKILAHQSRSQQLQISLSRSSMNPNGRGIFFRSKL